VFALDKLGLAAAERPVLAFHFDKVDYNVLKAQPGALVRAVRQRPAEAPFHVGITTLVPRQLDRDRIDGSADPEVVPVDQKVAERMLREDLKPLFQRDLERRVHGFLDRFVHRCSIVDSFARGQFNANEGHRLVSYRASAPPGELLSAPQSARADIVQRTRHETGLALVALVLSA
jgi:hypothetical protein